MTLGSSLEVQRYEYLWKSFRSTYRKGITRITSFLEASSSDQQNEILQRITEDGTPEKDAVVKLLGLKSSTSDVIAAALNKLNFEEWRGPEETQWIFSQVASQLDYSIFMADAEEIGYKRRKTGGDLSRPNQLFIANGDHTGSSSAQPASILEKLLTRSIPTASLQGFLTTLSNIGKQRFLRCDPKYRWYWDQMQGKIMPTSAYGFAPLHKFLMPGKKAVIKKGELPEERKLLELEDVEGGTGRIINFRLVDEVGSDKVEFGSSDIVFSKLEPYLCKAILNDAAQEYIGSTEWVPLDVNTETADKYFMWAFMISPIAKSTFRLLQSGKRHARLNLEDFVNILVPDVPKDVQEKAVELFEPQWQRMQEIRKELIERQKLLNKHIADSLKGTLPSLDDKAN